MVRVAASQADNRHYKNSIAAGAGDCAVTAAALLPKIEALTTRLDTKFGDRAFLSGPFITFAQYKEHKTFISTERAGAVTGRAHVHDEATIFLDSLCEKGKCLSYFSNDLLSNTAVGSELVVGRNSVWYEGVVSQVPGRRKRKKNGVQTHDPRLFHVMVSSDITPNPIVIELNDETYAQGCIAPSTIADGWAWAFVATYVACANVACGKCLSPYATAVGHACVKCKLPVHNLCSQEHAGMRELGAELCYNCRG